MRARLVWFSVFVLTVLALHAGAQTAPSPVIVGYIFPQDALLAPGQIDARSITRANYAFANIRDGRMVTGFAHDAENLASLTALRKQNPDFTVLVSVGGWQWSTHFSDVALTAASRTVFVDSVMEFLARYDLDGLDIDWEYPGLAGAGHTFRAQDGANFALLLQQLRTRFNAQEKQNHRRLYISIAAGASDDYLEHTNMAQVQRYVDTVNLMAYDYVEPGSDPLTGHHAPLYRDPADTRNYSADDSVRNFEKAGVPAGKLVLGVPFYGHVWGQVRDVNHGYLQPGKAVPNTYAPFSTIQASFLSQGFTRYWSPVSKAPYLYNSSTHVFVSYEDTDSLTAKCTYALDNHLAGVGFWEYSNDPAGTLLGVINKVLHHAALQ